MFVYIVFILGVRLFKEHRAKEQVNSNEQLFFLQLSIKQSLRVRINIIRTFEIRSEFFI